MKRDSQLFYITLSVLLPPIGIFLLAAADLFYSQKNVDSFSALYVEHFTENIASMMESGAPISADGEFYDSHERGTGMDQPLIFSRVPTFFAILNQEGEFLFGSDRLRNVIEESEPDIPVGIAREIASAGERFTITKFPYKRGNYWVVGAISWSDIPGSTAMSIFMWPALIASISLWSAFSVVKLWRRVINPIRWLEQKVSSLHWGHEPLSAYMGNANTQVRKIHETLVRVSQIAIKTAKTNRACMNDLVNVQEDERTKISRDIHDGPLQDVTALIQRIHLARRPDNSEEDTKRELDLAEKIAFTTVKEMRALCDFLNPPWLELGLSQALTELTERQSLQYGVKIFLGMDETLALSDSVTLAFFRIVQEAVTNSVRHGEARNIWIDLKRNDDGGIELTIQDDGHGFDMSESDTADLRAEGHRGLSNMEERMTLIGGQLKIISYRGEGACIRGLLP
ncbi:MAG: sensor histidine kinase [Synergistaceae bacterium]|nr:sensor histidine kinase [Synergistaceae bacterium]